MKDSQILQQTQQTNKDFMIKLNAERLAILSTAFTSITSEQHKKYYSDLDKEDLAHNIDMLFSELDVLNGMMNENIYAIIDEIRSGNKNEN